MHSCLLLVQPLPPHEVCAIGKKVVFQRKREERRDGEEERRGR